MRKHVADVIWSVAPNNVNKITAQTEHLNSENLERSNEDSQKTAQS